LPGEHCCPEWGNNFKFWIYILKAFQVLTDDEGCFLRCKKTRRRKEIPMPCCIHQPDPNGHDNRFLVVVELGEAKDIVEFHENVTSLLTRRREGERSPLSTGLSAYPYRFTLSRQIQSEGRKGAILMSTFQLGQVANQSSPILWPER
jgi:hypothetical protein